MSDHLLNSIQLALFYHPRSGVVKSCFLNFFSSSQVAFFWSFYLCHHDILTDPVCMSYSFTFYQNFEFNVLIFCVLTF